MLRTLGKSVSRAHQKGRAPFTDTQRWRLGFRGRCDGKLYVCWSAYKRGIFRGPLWNIHMDGRAVVVRVEWGGGLLW